MSFERLVGVKLFFGVLVAFLDLGLVLVKSDRSIRQGIAKDEFARPIQKIFQFPFF
jgi:hypothetical protein